MSQVPQSSVPLNRRTKLVFSPVDSANMVLTGMRYSRNCELSSRRNILLIPWSMDILEESLPNSSFLNP